MTPAELALVVRAVTDKVKRELPRPKFVPGTVVAYHPDRESDLAEVKIDGDPDGDTIEASSILTDLLAPGARVLVVFDPPQGAYIIGTVSSQVRPLMVFHLEGALSVSTSPDWPVEFDSSVTYAKARVTTVGSTDTVVDVLVDGTPITTLTIPAGENEVVETFDTVRVRQGSYGNADVTTAGTGAVDLVVTVY